ncbi:MAG TPA: alpha/beta hydrolase [Anaerovoracaceae bacterium]|nr:alpha/beta hydrolase [Anaerovoracaceae bacterium]
MAKLIEYIIKTSGMSKMKDMSEDELTEYIKKDNELKIPNKIRKRYEVQEIDIDNDKLAKISPKENASDAAVLFIHGGAYIMEMDTYHWHAVMGIIDKTNATVYVPIYKLAPNYSYIETDIFMYKAYEYLLNEYEEMDINIIGDSAGGQIALRLLDKGKYSPNKTILVSPLVYLNPDIELANQMKLLEKNDVILSTDFLNIVIDWWTNGKKLKYDDISAINGVYIFVGTNEILYSHAVRLNNEIKSSELIVGDGLMHTWPYMPGDRSCINGFSLVCKLLEG